MKKALIFTVLITFSLASCKKNSSVAPVNTFSATINGIDETFNTNLFAQNVTGITSYSNLSVIGSNGNASGSDAMSITLNTNGTINTGTYTNAPNSNVGFISISFSSGPVNLSNPNVYVSDVNGKYPTTVTITSISRTNVQGTFNAQLVYTDGKTIKTVTNGKFNVNLN